ncbi:uncharacterized protein LOC106758725 isoform X1 [Vigna radiata var. radiata]|uniref:Uncharacterized protein LOC106758725 isoform X1 n=2 Tax=Vigna radiata var. radiata TaxID=3916 RepID=A0A1S3TTV4_VIGRR|nr:uncharacterized protein LOC106758725 isoform X1 [Vigna radiata var. radiata]
MSEFWLKKTWHYKEIEETEETDIFLQIHKINTSFSAAMVIPIAVALVVILIGLVYQAIKPPVPKICGSIGAPQVTSPRVKLSDGRNLAYREFGVPKEEARYKIIVIHGYNSFKDTTLPVSQELIEELGIYFLHFDRAGYGESDPHSSRSVKSEAYDIQELADKLEIGDKFYIIGMSMGGYPVWSCLKYIPHRLSGAALVAPFISYWWPSFPDHLLREAFQMLTRSDKWTFRVAHHAPWLFHWWMTQKWFPSLTLTNMLSPDDIEIVKTLSELPNTAQEKITQQGEYESLHRDIMSAFGRWEFGPTEIENPFPDDNGSVHIWQGFEDRIIPYTLNRYISQKLPWILYHELPHAGHLFLFKKNECESIIRALVLSPHISE